MTLTLDTATLEALGAGLPEKGESPTWQVAHIAPVSLVVEGNARVCRLRLSMDLFLRNLGEASPFRFRGQLVSATWAPLAELPPRQVSIDAQTPELPAEASLPLCFTLSELSRPIRVGGSQNWLRYLQPIKAMASPAEEASGAAPVADALHQSLSEWLTHDVCVATVGEAADSAMHGPVGAFGPLEARVLERSSQADLAIDATWLGEVDNAAEQAGEPTVRLVLYGERFGAWVLHRCSLQPAKARAKQTTLPPSFAHEVLVAESSQQLIEQAGLGAVEKRLFQQVGILPHERLRSSAEEPSSADERPGLDLSGLADRSLRHLQVIASLAQQGKLAPADLDMLMKLARQLSRKAR
ncbi:hypothetical protein [Halomonas lysinitropha]|uniref:Uncharacterized protein n=1 Tax=Halomonas lysinitropha TaxID=2607506 RepID=A0A5K1I1J7_9GAMM|nr:hypothetical protein [Halomonas lysinitropha]VVZ95286.1 hypothetical protein HALO32_01351 [Halomonas lysinitropha]